MNDLRVEYTRKLLSYLDMALVGDFFAICERIEVQLELLGTVEPRTLDINELALPPLDSDEVDAIRKGEADIKPDTSGEPKAEDSGADAVDASQNGDIPADTEFPGDGPPPDFAIDSPWPDGEEPHIHTWDVESPSKASAERGVLDAKCKEGDCAETTTFPVRPETTGYGGRRILRIGRKVG